MDPLVIQRPTDRGRIERSTCVLGHFANQSRHKGGLTTANTTNHRHQRSLLDLYHKYSIGAVYLDVDVTKNIVTTSPSEGSILDDDGCVVDIVAAVGLNLMVAIDVFQWHSISCVGDVLVHKRLIHFVEGQEVVDTLQRDTSG